MKTPYNPFRTLIRIGHLPNRPDYLVYRDRTDGQRKMVFGKGWGSYMTKVVVTLENGWRPVDLILYGDNSTTLVMENREGERKHTQVIAPYGDAC